MTPDRIKKLDGIGFWWGLDHPNPCTDAAYSWDANSQRLEKYKYKYKYKHKHNGNVNVPLNTKGRVSGLAKWVSYQRAKYKY